MSSATVVASALRVKCTIFSRINIWAVSREKEPSNMRKMHRFRSSCTYAKYHLGLCSPCIHSLVFNDSVSGQ